MNSTLQFEVHILSLKTDLYRSGSLNKTLVLVHGSSELQSMSANPEEVTLGSSTGKKMDLFWCGNIIDIQADL